jgi:hypothetical protein
VNRPKIPHVSHVSSKLFNRGLHEYSSR